MIYLSGRFAGHVRSLISGLVHGGEPFMIRTVEQLNDVHPQPCFGEWSLEKINVHVASVSLDGIVCSCSCVFFSFVDYIGWLMMLKKQRWICVPIVAGSGVVIVGQYLISSSSESSSCLPESPPGVRYTICGRVRRISLGFDQLPTFIVGCYWNQVQETDYHQPLMNRH